MKKIGIFGLWHLGCVLTASWSKLGHQVIGFDYETKRIKDLEKGIPPIFEPELEETIKDGLNNGLLKFTNSLEDLKDCDFVFLSYDTPVNEKDESDTTILEQSILGMSKILKNNSIVIISSQSPVGYCSELRSLLKENNKTLELAYSPENLRLGEAIKCYLEPERIILGTSNEETEKECLDLFSKIQSDILSMSLESAEMVKHGINSFLATSIVFANHLSDICEKKKANIDDVIMGMKSDPRIGKKAYLAPGIGFSGGTLGRDLKVLEKVNKNGFSKIFGKIHEYNNQRKNSIISKIEHILINIEDKKIGVLGLTYKPGTSTLRRSIPLEIVEILIKMGADIKVFDPKADYNEIKNTKFQIKNNIKDVAKGSDMLIIMTEWEHFKNFDWQSIEIKPIIFDAKNFLDGDKLKEMGYKYYTIGK